MRDLDPSQYSAADRREVDPPIYLEMATWSRAGQLDWWVKERRPRVEWWGRVRGAMAGSGGLELLIFAPVVAQSPDSGDFCWRHQRRGD